MINPKVVQSEFDLTPVEKWGSYFVKRDDLFQLHGAKGGKLRQALSLFSAGAQGLIGYGGRRSNTATAMAAAGKEASRPVVFHTATGPETNEMGLATALGAIVRRHKPGYMSVLAARAENDLSMRGGWKMGLSHDCCIRSVAGQCENIPTNTRRIVVSCGAGITLAGIIYGTDGQIPILAIVVGAKPDTEWLKMACPRGCKKLEYKPSGTPYDHPAKDPTLEGLALDPYYEGKCVPFLEHGDLLWVAGIR